MTKLGHVPENSTPPEEAVEHAENKFHCIHPDFVRACVDASSERLGTTPDVVLLHNPEFFLTAAMRQRVSPRPLPEFRRRLEASFHALEELVAAGRVGSAYGVSSNFEGLRWSVSGRENGYESSSLLDMVQCARQAAARAGRAEHMFRAIQVPLNLLELGAAVGYIENPDTPEEIVRPSTLRLALQEGVGVMTNRPLNAISPPGVSLGDWGREGEREFLRIADRTPQLPLLALLRRVLREVYQGDTDHKPIIPSNAQATLAQLALFTPAALPGVAVGLCGARRGKYVADIKEVMAWRAPEQEVLWNAMDVLQDTLEEFTGSA